jgi:hypothetical protein
MALRNSEKDFSDGKDAIPLPVPKVQMRHAMCDLTVELSAARAAA